MKRKALNTPRLLELKKKKRRYLRNKILFYFFSFFFIFIIFVFISRIDRLNINAVSIEGNKIVDTELIKKVVDDNLNEYYLYFIPKTNFLLYPKNKIRNDLYSQFYRLQNISFKLDSSGILNISTEEREAKYTYCGEELLDKNNIAGEEICYFMDKNGYIFDLAPYFSGDVYFRFLGELDSNQGDKILGSYFFKEKFNDLIILKENISNLELNPISLYVKDDGDVELYLSSKSSSENTPKIIFKNDFTLEKLYENLQSAVAVEPLKSNLINKYDSLLYIDLRFGNKVYYKFK